MPAKQLILPQSVQKRLAKLPARIKGRITKALLRLKKNPLSGIKLQGELSGYFKLRLGDYRIIYRFRNKVVEILAVEHRQGVYK